MLKVKTLKRGAHLRRTARGFGYEAKGTVYRYKNPYANLLYNVLLQAMRDNDIDYLKHGDGLTIWEYLRTEKER